jgi:response regulator RpfG family c-di-GMP phosphodiesterase
MEATKKKVLLVDDEKSILMCLRRLLRSDEYETYGTTDINEALNYCKDNDVDLVLSDMRMPEMNGADFLKKVEDIRPLATRIVLSGYSERDTLMAAINGGHIWSFILKPWDNESLKLSVHNGLARAQDKKDREKLLNELELKNDQLKGINQKLEGMVKERTEEVEVRSSFLQSILDEENMSPILDNITEYLSKKAQAKVQFLNHPDHQTPGPGVLAITKNGRILGVLRTHGDVLVENSSLIQRFVPLVALAASMDMDTSCSGLRSQIDDLMQDM